MTGAQYKNEHNTEALQDTSIHYWHVQAITVAQTDVTVARGLRPGLGLEAIIPVRLVRGRIRYEDLARRPYTLQYPDYHHRNETSVRLADPTVSLHLGHVGSAWTLSGRAGVSIPLGRTEPNPFELGRLGLPHEHFQFGTGAWDPVFVLAAGRQLGHTPITATAFAHLRLYENDHGYRAGDRYSLSLSGTRPIRGEWSGSLTLDFTREEAERWSGLLEEEGNLGRTDAMVSVGVGRPVAGASLSIAIGIPVYSRVHGEQGEQPLVFSLTWTH